MHSAPSINQIFGQNKNEYLNKYPGTTSFERKIIHLLTVCRTEELGARVYQCSKCNHQEILYGSSDFIMEFFIFADILRYG